MSQLRGETPYRAKGLKLTLEEIANLVYKSIGSFVGKQRSHVGGSQRASVRTAKYR
jgi:hypothetical protein